MKNALFVLVVLLAASLCCSCGQKESRPPVVPEPASTPDIPSQGIDIGKVEYSLILDTVLADKSHSPNITNHEMTNPRYRLDLVTLDVAPPYPETLWLTLRQSFAQKLESTPVVFRAVISRDNTPIALFNFLIDPDAPLTPYEYTFNAFEGLSSLPETMLISAQAEIIILPAGTDPAQIDVDTYEGTPEVTGAVLSNPVRINLK